MLVTSMAIRIVWLYSWKYARIRCLEDFWEIEKTFHTYLTLTQSYLVTLNKLLTLIEGQWRQIYWVRRRHQIFNIVDISLDK